MGGTILEIIRIATFNGERWLASYLGCSSVRFGCGSIPLPRCCRMSDRPLDHASRLELVRGMIAVMMMLGRTALQPAFETFDDRAVWPVVAVTGVGEHTQGSSHLLKLRYFLIQFSDVSQRQCLHVGTRATFVGPQTQQIANFVHRKSKIAGSPDEPEPM